MRDYTNLPVELCIYAIKNRKENQLRLYLLLKLSSDGYITLSNQNKATWAKELSITVKTINSSLAWLIKQKWVAVNSKRGALHIISYSRLSQKLGTRFTTGFAYDTGVHRDFRALCAGVIIAHYLKRKRYFDRRRSGSLKGGPTTNRIKGGRYTQMANGYLARCLEVSNSTAFRLKEEAERAGYIKTRFGYSYLKDSKGERLSVKDYQGYRDYARSESGKDVIRQGRKGVVKVEADHICTYLPSKRKRCKTLIKKQNYGKK